MEKSSSGIVGTEREAHLDRVSKALALVDRDGLGLEIGPSHSPIAPKREGFKVHVLDLMSTSELRDTYKVYADIDVEKIEEVDFVWRGEPLTELVGGSDKYDWIIASHVLEHVSDPITLLAGCEQVLKPDGVASLIIPDKRFCFDYFRPLSTTGQLLDAFDQKLVRPTRGTVFDHNANAVRRDGEISWTAENRGGMDLVLPVEEASRRWMRETGTDDYSGVHVWGFIPLSFRLILQDLRDLGLTNLEIKKEYETAGNEFHVTLGVGGSTNERVERLFALRQIEQEVVDVARTGSHDDPIGEKRSEGTTEVISKRERQLIAVKRRVFETIRGTTRRSASLRREL